MPPQDNSYRELLDRCWLGDRYKLQRELHRLERRQGSASDLSKKRDSWRERLQASVARVDEREQKRPEIRFPADLPVCDRADDIGKAIFEHQVVIVAGATGSGKTTQLPKICLQQGRGLRGMIAHTQPRRIAARSVAARIAEELDSEVGQAVGYDVRFDRNVSDDSYIKLVTDGMLLAEIANDRWLNQYDTIIVDEAHERSLNIDFLLGYLHQLLARRPELKLIITSATIDVERFSKHFNNAPIISVEGRSYPVDVIYAPPFERDMTEAVVDALETLNADGAREQGDVLVFFPGEGEIRQATKAIKNSNLADIDVLPLYARLGRKEQSRIFDLRQRRGWRIILATNVAETSLTVPGIRFVIDTGQARISRYSFHSKIQRLPIEAISQASANQRSGRCGRLGPGVAIRLYDEDDFSLRPEFTEPEIQRSNLAAVILQMMDLGLGDIERFAFIDAPDHRLIRDGYRGLEELGAVSDRKLTPLGKRLAKLPLDPRLARMLLAATQHRCLEEILVIASALSVQDPRERPAEKQQAADEKHRRFTDLKSDFIALLNLWNYIEEQRQTLSANAFKRLCNKEYLSWNKLREWRDIHWQLSVQCKRLGLERNSEPAEYEAIHRSLLTGLLSNVATLDEGREFLGARNRKLAIFPGSGLHKKPPKWIVAAELAETSRLFARTVAQINPEWLLGINDSLLKKHHSEPHYQKRSGKVMAKERCTLYGLTLYEGKRVHFGAFEPKQAREIFIQQALVEGLYRGGPAFWEHNQNLVADVQVLESKTRRRDILVTDDTLYQFYDARLPDFVNTAAKLEKWLRQQPDETLKFSREDLINDIAAPWHESQFPDAIDLSSGHGQPPFELVWRFEPGHSEDGATVQVPVALLNRIDSVRSEWLVEGLLRDKCIALIKTLPKSLRKQVTPVPDFIDAVISKLDRSKPLLAALTEVFPAEVSAEAWAPENIEAFYRFNYRVLSENGKELAQSRNLDKLKSQFSSTRQQALDRELDKAFDVATSTRWSFGDIPKKHTYTQSGVEVTSFPALVDKGDGVSVELMDSQTLAEDRTFDGVVRLLLLKSAGQVKTWRSRLLSGNKCQLEFAAVAQSRSDWIEQLLYKATAHHFLTGEQLPNTEHDFDSIWSKRGDFAASVEQLAEVLRAVLASWADIARALQNFTGTDWQLSLQDIEGQMTLLLGKGFIRDTPWEELQQYPRFLQALSLRIAKLTGSLSRDVGLSTTLIEFQSLLRQYWQPSSKDELLTEFRWSVEEFRVSLFGQNLRTRFPVSEKRLRALWKKWEAAQLPSV